MQNMVAIKDDWLLWFTNFLTKNLLAAALLMKQIISWQMNFIDLLLENLRKEKYIHHLKTIFGE